MQCVGDLLNDERCVAEGSEIGPGEASKTRCGAVCCLTGKSSLATPTGAGQRDQARGFNQPSEVRELVVTTDEAREMHRQLRGCVRFEIGHAFGGRVLLAVVAQDTAGPRGRQDS